MRALGWMACSNSWYFVSSINGRQSAGRVAVPQLTQQLSADIGQLLPIEGRLMQEPIAKRGVDVNRWSSLRRAVDADEARLYAAQASPADGSLRC